MLSAPVAIVVPTTAVGHQHWPLDASLSIETQVQLRNNLNAHRRPKRICLKPRQTRTHVSGICGSTSLTRRGVYSVETDPSNTSIHDIQMDAGVSIGSIFNYFGGTEGIAKAL